jgi:hypothetical protein
VPSEIEPTRAVVRAGAFMVAVFILGLPLAAPPYRMAFPARQQ